MQDADSECRSRAAVAAEAKAKNIRCEVCGEIASYPLTSTDDRLRDYTLWLCSVCGGFRGPFDYGKAASKQSAIAAARVILHDDAHCGAGAGI